MYVCMYVCMYVLGRITEVEKKDKNLPKVKRKKRRTSQP
jgi:hypothetical protein